MLGNEQRAREAFANADEVAQRLGLKRLEFDGLLLGLYVSIFHLHFEHSEEMAERAVTLAHELDLPSGEGQAHFFASGGAMFRGDQESARSHSDAFREIAERLRDLGAIAAATYNQA